MSVDLAWWGTVLGNAHESLTHRRGRSARAIGATDETYVLLPHRRDPRVVVDVSSPDALRDAVARFADRSLPGAVGRAIPVMNEIIGRFGSRWVVTRGVQPTLREHLSDVLQREVRLSIAVGPPRPNRKPVVRCFAGSEMIAVAKLGPESHTAALVSNEADWLRALNDRPFEDVHVPELLYRGTYGSSELLVMSVLPLATETPAALGDMPAHALETLIDRFGTTHGLRESEYWKHLRARLHPAIDESWGARVQATIESTDSDPASEGLAMSFWHGDWSPWNVAPGTDRRWCVWDWERSAIGVPIGFDQLHLHYQYGAGLVAGLTALVDSGLSTTDAGLIRNLYLLELVARHIEAGATGTDRHTAVIDQLRSHEIGAVAADGTSI